MSQIIKNKLIKKYKKGVAGLDRWNKFVKKIKNPSFDVRIGLIGKYVELQDSYKSILVLITC